MQVTKTGIAFPTTPTVWQQGAGVRYTLNVKKDGKVTATAGQDWSSGAGGDISGKEKGIGSVIEWVAFTKLWNTNGLPTSADGTTPDYTLYEDYGRYETKGTSRIFTIKLTASFLLTGTVTGELYTPVGTDTHPLTLPIDGRDGKSALTCRTVPNLLRERIRALWGIHRQVLVTCGWQLFPVTALLPVTASSPRVPRMQACWWGK